MAGVAAANPRHQFFDTDGTPLAGGFVHTYLAGTTTETDTWQDRAQTTLNTNPIELNAAGACQIVLDSALTYKFVVTDSAGVVQSHLGADNIVGAAGVSFLADALADIQDARDAAETAIDALVTEGESVLADTEAARDAAFGNANVYADTTAGLAAVSSGAQFMVVENDDIVRYEDNAGSAVEKARFPTTDKLLPAITLAHPWVTVIEDGAGGYHVPVFQYEPDLEVVFINGRVEAVTDVMTDNGDGSYTATEIPRGLTSGVTMLVEWTREGHAGNVSGVYASMVANTTSLAGEVGAYAVMASTSGGGDVAGIKTANRAPASIQQVDLMRWGSTRGVLSVPASGDAKYMLEEQSVYAGATSTQYAVPIAFTIGRRPGSSPSVLTNATIRRVIVYPGAMATAQMEALIEATEPDPAPETQVYPHWLAVIDEGNGSKIVPSFQFDPIRERCWYNGQERAISDVLTDNGDGSWTMIKPPKGLRSTTGVTVFTDVRPDDYYTYSSLPSGYPLHSSAVCLNPAGVQERLQFSITASGVYDPGGLINPSMFSSKAGNSASVGGAISTSYRGQGISRYGIACPTSGAILVCSNASIPKESGLTVASYVAQDYFRFGALYGGTSVLTNATLHQVIIYSQTLTADQMQKVSVFNEYRLPPLWFVGDSFNNGSSVADMLRIHLANAGATYLPMSSSGLGSRGLSYFEELIEDYVTTYDALRDYVLVLVEGSLDSQSLAVDGVTTVGPYTEQEYVTYVRDIFKKFRNRMQVFMEPHTNQAAGDGTLSAVLTRLENIRDTFPDAYCPTNALLQAQASSSANYVAHRAAGTTPSAMRSDTIHLSWGVDPDGADSGYFWWCLALLHHLMARGWNPRKPL